MAPKYCGTCGADLAAAPGGRFCPKCGAAREQRSIDRFEVRAVLGRGVAGTLFRAFDPALGRLVALRQLSRDITEQPDRFSRVQRAAAQIAGIADRHVVEVFNLLTDVHPPLLVTEYVAGPSAQQVIALRGRLDTASALTASAGAIEGLASLHSLGLVHGYVTPSAILIDVQGDSKIANVGLGGLGFGADELMFLAPEALEGAALTFATDVFAIGAVLSALLSGRAPFPAQTLNQALARRQEPPTNLGELPNQIAALLATAMATDPTARPSNVAEFGAELRTVAESELGGEWRIIGAGALAATVAGALATGAVLIPDAIAVATATFAAGVGVAGASAAGAAGAAGTASTVAAGHAATGIAHGTAAAAGTAAGTAGTAGTATTGTTAGSTGIMSALAAKPVVAATVATVAVAGGGTTAYVVTRDNTPKVAAPVCAGISNCTVVAHVDVDGDGLPDEVGMYSTGAVKAQQPAEDDSASWTVRVSTALGPTAAIAKPTQYLNLKPGATPWFGASDIDGQPGQELVTHDIWGAHTLWTWVFAWRGGQLVALPRPEAEPPDPENPYRAGWAVDAAQSAHMQYQCGTDGVLTSSVASWGDPSTYDVTTSRYRWNAGGWQSLSQEKTTVPRSAASSLPYGWACPGLPNGYEH